MAVGQGAAAAVAVAEGTVVGGWVLATAAERVRVRGVKISAVIFSARTFLPGATGVPGVPCRTHTRVRGGECVSEG